MILVDAKNTPWISRLDFEAALRVRDTGLDLMRYALDDDYHSEVMAPESLHNTILNSLYAICYPVALTRGVDASYFGKLLRKISIDDLYATFSEAVDAFFHIPGVVAAGDSSANPRPAELWELCYRLAGECGVSPLPHTLGELVIMADSRRKAEWSRTASLRADIRNSRFGVTRPESPASLDPTGGLKETNSNRLELTVDNFNLLKGIFGGRGK